MLFKTKFVLKRINLNKVKKLIPLTEGNFKEYPPLINLSFANTLYE